MSPQKKQKDLIKERIRLSNEAFANGLEPDKWVVEYRIKNNEIKAKWKAKQPKKDLKGRTSNSGSFKKGAVPKNKLTPEQKTESLKRWAENTKKWHKENKERINFLARERKRKNPSIRIKANLRKRLSTLVSKAIAKKHSQTMDLLGCDIIFFLEYLQNKFTEGMTLENYGKWHLDHIIPCYYFDLIDIEEQKKCFHFTNIQPMWAIDNLRKNKHIKCVKELEKCRR
jgi:hypothetical protein